MSTTKECRKCGKTKPITEYFNQKRNRDGKFHECKDCVNDANELWRRNNPDKLKAIQRNQFSKHRHKRLSRQRAAYHATPPGVRSAKKYMYNLRAYGLTPEMVGYMIEAQGGNCAICGGPPDGKHGKLNIDHDHLTGSVRKLLCTECNTGIGKFKDSPSLMKRAIQYLLDHGKSY